MIKTIRHQTYHKVVKHTFREQFATGAGRGKKIQPVENHSEIYVMIEVQKNMKYYFHNIFSTKYLLVLITCMLFVN